MGTTLNVCEIFLSIQGEGTRCGVPCAFVRLGGCNLRCDWCDTKYAWERGEDMSISDLLKRVEELNCPRVEVTGGEPLIQTGTPELLCRVCDGGYETLLETNGSIDMGCVDSRVIKIVDFKCPSSGEDDKNLWKNVDHLTGNDEVKFVLADRTDYEFAKSAVTRYQLLARCAVIFAPVTERLDPGKLARWILDDSLDVRLGVQLHKIIFPNADRGI